MKKKRGFTLMELIIFIVISGIIANTIAMSYSTIFGRRMAPSSSIVGQQTIISQAAIRCMEGFLGQRAIKNFASIQTGTTLHTLCAAPAGATYSISSNVTDYTLDGATKYKKIDISLKEISTGKTVTTLSTIIADY